MYDANSITELSTLIGFGDSIKGDTTVDAANKVGTSLMVFKSFHNLVEVDNLLSSFASEISSVPADVNIELTRIRTDSAKRVLADILDQHIDYDDETDYSELILTKMNLFSKPFGFAVCISCLELMMSSGRFNVEQRSIRESYATLKLELEGAKSDQGKTLSYGIISKYNYSVKQCQKVIFQIKPTVDNKSNW